MISLRGPKFKYFAAVMGVLCLVMGIYYTFFQTKGFLETTGTIVDVEASFDGEDTTYYPIVEYSVDGVTYTEKLDRGLNQNEVGDDITVHYNPEDPTVIHDSGFIGIYLIVVGVVVIGIIVYSTVKGGQNKKEVEEVQQSGGWKGYAPHVEGEERELYFLTDLGTPKYGHRIEDANRRVLYEAKMTKFAVAVAFEFDFIDHEHGGVTPRLLGHREDVEWNSFFIDNHSTFEIDGVDIWKHLKKNGISVESAYTAGEATAVGMKYRIMRDGIEIAVAEMTSQYPHEEDAAKHKIAAAIPVSGFFRIWTKEQNLDLLFVTLLAFARTGAGDAKGGNFGALVGTFKGKKDK